MGPGRSRAEVRLGDVSSAHPRTPVYLDNAATTPLGPRVLEAMRPWLESNHANPSTLYGTGVDAREAVDRARSQVAAAVGARAADVTFTGGGTEANNMAVLGLARGARKRGRHVLIGPVEHPCVRMPAEALVQEGYELEVVEGDGAGALCLEDLERKLREDTVLVSLMAVINELGTRQPVAEAARVLRRSGSGAAFHVDAVQALGKVELDLTELGATSLAIAAHKVHGPKGVGALIRAADTPRPLPLVFGGGQEDGLRPGTENVAGIVGLGVAAARSATERTADESRLEELRSALEKGLDALPDWSPLIPRERSVPGILSLRVGGPPAQVWQHHLEQEGVQVGLGSACSSRSTALSPAWRAVGLDTTSARQVLRFSLSASTTDTELSLALEAVARVASRLESLV